MSKAEELIPMSCGCLVITVALAIPVIWYTTFGYIIIHFLRKIW